MRAPRLLALTVALTAGCSMSVIQAFAETVGKAVSIRTIVTGDKGELKTADPISRNERIRANQFGLGQFVFIDGSKLAVGPNSTVVVDEYVLGEGNRFKKLALNATRGAFRWISGKSPSSAYQISTPAGSLGVRGTAVDVTVRGNAAMMVLLQGSARWCTQGVNRGQCVTVRRPCDFIIARRGSGISDPQPVSRTALSEIGVDAAPFLRDNRRLLASFRLGRNNCGMGQRVTSPPSGRADARPTREGRPDPEPPSES
jgi:hypothetical protein